MCLFHWSIQLAAGEFTLISLQSHSVKGKIVLKSFATVKILCIFVGFFSGFECFFLFILKVLRGLESLHSGLDTTFETRVIWIHFIFFCYQRCCIFHSTARVGEQMCPLVHFKLVPANCNHLLYLEHEKLRSGGSNLGKAAKKYKQGNNQPTDPETLIICVVELFRTM